MEKEMKKLADEILQKHHPNRYPKDNDIKKAMIEIHHFIEDEKIPAKMLLQVHDELVFEVENSIADEFSGQVKQIMENAMELNVPIIVDSGLGANWLEAHQ